MWAVPLAGWRQGSYVGQLPIEWAKKINEDSPTYVVYSYGTPIAWVAEDGRVVIPDESYSTTTTRQQNLCRAWLIRPKSVGVDEVLATWPIHYVTISLKEEERGS